ncbi:hypothetical protein J3F83DRAFT_686083 [Trichoderma novae-zelandiae]
MLRSSHRRESLLHMPSPSSRCHGIPIKPPPRARLQPKRMIAWSMLRCYHPPDKIQEIHTCITRLKLSAERMGSSSQGGRLGMCTASQLVDRPKPHVRGDTYIVVLNISVSLLSRDPLVPFTRGNLGQHAARNGFPTNAHTTPARPKQLCQPRKSNGEKSFSCPCWCSVRPHLRCRLLACQRERTTRPDDDIEQYRALVVGTTR